MRAELMQGILRAWLKLTLLKLSGRPARRGTVKSRSRLDARLPPSRRLRRRSRQRTDFDDAAFTNPSATLRPSFASEAHPGGDLVDFIPAKGRRQFVRGLLLAPPGMIWRNSPSMTGWVVGAAQIGR